MKSLSPSRFMGSIWMPIIQIFTRTVLDRVLALYCAGKGMLTLTAFLNRHGAGGKTVLPPGMNSLREGEGCLISLETISIQTIPPVALWIRMFVISGSCGSTPYPMKGVITVSRSGKMDKANPWSGKWSVWKLRMILQMAHFCWLLIT